ncbi:MAG: 5-(carboxyamino)imidazole ribonucleotide mutase [Chloroflexota bacterium]|nr:MAG: 5-(carboxyamino)imidazole ribonucleotide mutase [Chloroflexota bacterium]
MGSDSDWPTLKPAADILREFDIPFEARVLSVHRTPDRLAEYARSAHERGLRVLIAAAGGAAHLPGMTAAYTTLPVIGVPVPHGHLQGIDALLSIVQMPRGVPVATVAIGNSTNAGLLAIRILASGNPALTARLLVHRDERAAAVIEADRRIADEAAAL